ncbi:MAG: hypothetical protein KGH91_05945 [Rhodospirillales bacterium]|nr:hypothetical protein [Rhodospirillales bacterium]
MALQSFESRFRVAGNILILASASFDIWWFYECENTRDLPALNEFPTFFRYDSEAHFRNMIVSLCTLYDKARGSIKIETLLEEVQIKAPTKVNLIMNTYVSAQPRAKKIKKLRDNLFAHRNKQRSVNQIYREAQLTGDDCKILISDTLAWLNMIADALEISSVALSPFVTSEAAQIMRRIKRSKPRRRPSVARTFSDVFGIDNLPEL